MTHEKIRQALLDTQKLIPISGAPVRHDLNVHARADASLYDHLRWMISEARSWSEDRTEKANRWLGFVQGALWSRCDVSIEQLRKVNMP